LSWLQPHIVEGDMTAQTSWWKFRTEHCYCGDKIIIWHYANKHNKVACYSVELYCNYAICLRVAFLRCFMPSWKTLLLLYSNPDLWNTAPFHRQTILGWQSH
jgi:hypothetical protein